MIRRPPRSNRTDTPFPYTTRFRSDGAGMARIGVLRDAVDEDEGHAGLRPPNWRMIARTLPERIGAAPRDFSHRDGRASLSTRAHRASFDDATASKGVGRMAREVARQILAGINDLVIKAPIRGGCITRSGIV